MPLVGKPGRDVLHQLGGRTAVQPLVVGQIRTDEAAQILAVTGLALIARTVEDRSSLRQAVLVGEERQRRRLWARPAAATAPAPRRGDHLGPVLGQDARPSEPGLEEQVIVDDVHGGEDDREVEAPQPPARQRVVELANAVDLVTQQLVAFLVSHCPPPATC